MEIIKIRRNDRRKGVILDVIIITCLTLAVSLFAIAKPRSTEGRSASRNGNRPRSQKGEESETGPVDGQAGTNRANAGRSA